MQSEDELIKELEAENRHVKITLVNAVLAKDILKCLIEEVDSYYGTDVKKLRYQRSVDVWKKINNRIDELLSLYREILYNILNINRKIILICPCIWKNLVFINRQIIECKSCNYNELSE